MRADFHQARTPGAGELPGAFGGAESVVAAGQNLRFKRQPLQWNSRPARQQRLQILSRQIGRGHQQRGAHALQAARVRRPGSHLQAAQAVRDQHGGLVAGQQHFFKPGNPVAAQRALPVVLLDAHIAVQALPAALPVLGAAPLPAGQRQDVARLHWMRSTISRAKAMKACAPLEAGSKITPGRP